MWYVERFLKGFILGSAAYDLVIIGVYISRHV